MSTDLLLLGAGSKAAPDPGTTEQRHFVSLDVASDDGTILYEVTPQGFFLADQPAGLPNGAYHLAWSSDGQFVVTASEVWDYSAALYRRVTGTNSFVKVRDFSVASGGDLIDHAEFTRDGSELQVVSFSFMDWPLIVDSYRKSQNTYEALPFSFGIGPLKYSTNGEYALHYDANSDILDVYRRNPYAYDRIGSINTFFISDDTPLRASFTPDHSEFVACPTYGPARAYTVGASRAYILPTLSARHEEHTDVHYSLDGKYLYLATDNPSNSLGVFDATTLLDRSPTILNVYSTNSSQVKGLGLSTDGKFLALYDTESVWIYSVEGGTLTAIPGNSKLPVSEGYTPLTCHFFTIPAT